MDIQTAVTTVVTQKYADFSGRARRSEYWFFVLAYVIAEIVVRIIGAIIGTQILLTIFALALLVPGLAVGARRLHDTGRSGWWLLLILTVIGAILLLVWFVEDSNPGDNQYGPSPKGQGGYNPTPGSNPTWGQN